VTKCSFVDIYTNVLEEPVANILYPEDSWFILYKTSITTEGK
jgi:hypothetical protein